MEKPNKKVTRPLPHRSGTYLYLEMWHFCHSQKSYLRAVRNLAVIGYHLFFHYFRTRTVRPTLYGAFLPRKWASRKIRAYALIFRNPVHVRFCLFQNLQRKK